MTIQDKIKFTFRKYPNCRFNRGLTYWFIGLNHYDFGEDNVSKIQLLAFFKDFGAIERSVREVLKEKEFELPPEADNKRLIKANKYREEYKK